HRSAEIRGNRMNDCTEQFHRDHEYEGHDHPDDDGSYAAKRCGHSQSPYGLIAMVDILEQFTREELDPLLESVAERLAPGGRLIASVPNADSAHAARAIDADITHEIAFTPTSSSELSYCHGLKVVG